MAEVVVYTRDLCGYCAAAVNLLNKKGVAFTEINATGNAALRSEMIEKSGGGTTFPQIFIDRKPVGGCNELFDLEDSGELDRLLGGAPVS